MPPEVRIGCSGWQYKPWRSRFYPADLPATRWLPYYADVFDTTEVNSTFYGLPAPGTFQGWRVVTPPRFLFALKVSRYLTHLKRLREPAPPLALFFGRALLLGRRLGPVLYQLPGNFHFDPSRLQGLLDALPRSARDVPRPEALDGDPLPRPRERVVFRHVLEFRHRSWYRDDVFRMLDAAGVALCLHDKAGSEYVGDIVGPFVYVRFHGTSGHYSGSYPQAALEAWAARLRPETKAGRDVFAYFNNDVDVAAVGNARSLRAMLTTSR